MTTSTSPTTAEPATRTATPPQWPRWVFRGTSLVAAVMLLDQAVFAGQFLAGSYGALHTHRENATYAGICVLISMVAAVLLRVPGRGPWWPIAANLGIFGLVALQIVLGFARSIAIHVPLGVVTILLAVLLAIWAWKRS